MQEKYMQGCRSEFLSACISTALAASREASVMTEKGQVTSGIHRTGADEEICLRCSKACC